MRAQCLHGFTVISPAVFFKRQNNHGSQGAEKLSFVAGSGYIIKWFIGDHSPRHVHIETETEKLLGRFNLETMSGMAGWQPPGKLVKIIKDLQREGRL
jgi:hypothetical protein